MGALAAGLLAAALLLRAPTVEGPPLPQASSAAAESIETLDLLIAGEDLDLATEADLYFYEWVAAAAETPAGDGMG
jgi:hypothetical protein